MNVKVHKDTRFGLIAACKSIGLLPSVPSRASKVEAWLIGLVVEAKYGPDGMATMDL